MVQLKFCLQTFVFALSGLLLVGCDLPVGSGGSQGGATGGIDSGDTPFTPEGGTGSGSDSTGGPTGLPSCAPVAELACGSHAVGDTSDFNSGATDELDSYPIAVGNYDAREVAYSFKAASDGTVSFQFVDPSPTSVDHDIFLLVGDTGCNADSAIERGHNSLSFMALADETY